MHWHAAESQMEIQNYHDFLFMSATSAKNSSKDLKKKKKALKYFAYCSITIVYREINTEGKPGCFLVIITTLVVHNFSYIL